MYSSTILALLSALFLSVPVMSMPVNETLLEERWKKSGLKPGTATYFDAGLGACGHTDNNNVPLVALSTKIYNKKLCNQIVEIKYPKTGKTAKVPVRDACPGCDANHLDLSPAVWNILGADEALGVIDIEFEGPK
ncbi:RlpA-like double-psi beta-barrel-containing domain containing protein [Tylopilus felleus]